MGKNYYKILGISPSSDIEQIKKGYRRAVLSWHPAKTKVDKADAAKNFKEASEAYDVLSKNETRAIYDMFGYETLINGLYDDSKIIFPAYQFNKEPIEVYQKFMLEANPFVRIIDFDGRSQQGSMFGYASLGLNWCPDTTPHDIEVTAECSLEEFYFGCQKDVTYKCNLFNDDRRTTHEEIITKRIIIKPGYNKNTILTFPKEGSDRMNCERGNLIVKLTEIKHPHYRRKTNDLHYTVTINLLEAISACAIRIETLDKRILMLSVDECLNPEKTIVLPNEGMPIYHENPAIIAKGDFIVHFNLIMPLKVPQARYEDLRKILPIS
ncbi:unnamed protein product [Blepharisma stoltei]|uniref:J domain-containing protein n=1 Tax=Blepharisma stoltei TaxID=1481888 RepID=A0AAU9IFT2_9CILI|nr:unnamed protein product [Blepharisma stoltei]